MAKKRMGRLGHLDKGVPAHGLWTRELPSAMAIILTTFLAAGCSGASVTESAAVGEYPWHTDVVAATFWIGEVYDPEAEDGSQVYSTYDSQWETSYGGCDGRDTPEDCHTEERVAGNGFFPRNMVPKENPFYLDLPFDDVNNPEAFSNRSTVIPWAADQADGNTALYTDRNYSFMKNRWVQISKGGRVCYGQIQDAGPGEYNDAEYVFGDDDKRPASSDFNGAGMDVSPALNGCLGFAELEGLTDRVDWRFVEAENVPHGPWKKLVTTSQVK